MSPHGENTQKYQDIETRGVDVVGEEVDTYVVSFPCVLTYLTFPVDGCPKRAHNMSRVFEHFMYRQGKAKIAILQEGPSPLLRYTICGIYMPAAILERHKHIARCDR